MLLLHADTVVLAAGPLRRLPGRFSPSLRGEKLELGQQKGSHISVVFSC